MSTKTCITLAFKMLVSANPYASVHIDTLCKEAGVSRSTFYSYFTNKEALTKTIVFDDILGPVHNIRTVIPTEKIQHAPQLINTRMYQSILESRDFYEQIVSACPAVFIDTLTNGLVDINNDVLKDSDISSLEKEYRAYYYAIAQVMYMIKWIKDGMTVEPDVLANWVYEWGGGYWKMPFVKSGL